MARRKKTPIKDDEIIALTQFQHARMRTTMYLGSTVSEKLRFPIINDSKVIEFREFEYVPAILVSFREAIDNALDELTKCGGGDLKVDYDHKSLIFKISDNGRGIPIEFSKELGTYKATAALSETRTGRNFMEREGTAGMNGLGISIVNMCSNWFQTYIERDGKSFFQRFDPGEIDLIISEPVIGESKSRKTGTTIEFQLSKNIFKGTLPEEIVESLLYQISVSQPDINVYFNGSKIAHKVDPKMALFGKSEDVHHLKLGDSGKINLFIAPSDTFEHFSLVNNIPTINGGSHIDALKFKFGKYVLEYLKKESRKRKLNPNSQDVLNCCFFYMTIFMNSPEFDGQTKSRLLNPELAKQIHDYLDPSDMSRYNLPSKIVEMIYDRCSARTGRKDKAEIDKKEKELKKKKVPSLSDATAKDRTKCTLALFEGFSASSSYLSVRNVETQASMPLRGKIRNTWGLRPKSALKSETIDQICAAIGIVPGKSADPANLRYSQIQIYTDADHDGSNITGLIIALFYNFWPELFDREWLEENNKGKPFIVMSLTPLFAVQKGKERRYFYVGEHFDMDELKKQGWKFVSRFKGLGALDNEEWVAHVNDKKSKIPVLDDGRLEAVLNTNFGDRSSLRKKMLQGELTVENANDHNDFSNEGD